MPKSKREIAFTVRLTPQVKADAEKWAKASDMSLAQFIRRGLRLAMIEANARNS
jgi:predicted HicB family RNase H-like nuclease